MSTESKLPLSTRGYTSSISVSSTRRLPTRKMKNKKKKKKKQREEKEKEKSIGGNDSGRNKWEMTTERESLARGCKCTRVEHASLSVSSFHVLYQMGVIRGLLRAGVHVNRVWGVSGGAIGGTQWLLSQHLGRPFFELDECLGCMPEGRPYYRRDRSLLTRILQNWVLDRHGFDADDALPVARSYMLKKFADRLGQWSDAHRVVDGRLSIVMCEWPSLRRVCISRWPCNARLLEALTRTTAIPWVTTPHPQDDWCHVVDRGIPACCASGRCGPIPNGFWGTGDTLLVDGGFTDSHPLPPRSLASSSSSSSPFHDTDADLVDGTLCISTCEFPWWSDAARRRSRRYPDIGRPLPEGSAHWPWPRSFYRHIAQLGEQDAWTYIQHRHVHHS